MSQVLLAANEMQMNKLAFVWGNVRRILVRELVEGRQEAVGHSFRYRPLKVALELLKQEAAVMVVLSS